ncbi:thaumatin-like protein [Phtheirospermum japonicum]|uniref:Thaumatin-like protein n=1 Tax=Phtheirospermum japonicum TaxID=374723 RepID=A0A830CZM0_9LAMI|nr:thaumatin-like protein [Phtheirospermum japonicum]
MGGCSPRWRPPAQPWSNLGLQRPRWDPRSPSLGPDRLLVRRVRPGPVPDWRLQRAVAVPGLWRAAQHTSRICTQPIQQPRFL